VDHTSHVNDGTPTSVAVAAFNALAAPLRWNNIGSRIDFSVANGTRGTVATQVYPTYFIYKNLERNDVRIQASEPIGNFNPNPYPPGPAPFIVEGP